MIKLEVTTRFKYQHKRFVKKSSSRQKLVAQTLNKLLRNPNHPSLNIEKLSGSGYWSIRIDKSNRIFFIWLEKTVIMLIDIGSHDKYRKY